MMRENEFQNLLISITDNTSTNNRIVVREPLTYHRRGRWFKSTTARHSI